MKHAALKRAAARRSASRDWKHRQARSNVRRYGSTYECGATSGTVLRYPMVRRQVLAFLRHERRFSRSVLAEHMTKY